jgi:hypothetical protein
MSWLEEGVPRAPRPAVAVPPAPANYVPQSLRPAQPSGAIAASDEDQSPVSFKLVKVKLTKG